MNDFKVTMAKRHQLYLSKVLPKGYSFKLFKVRKNINDYPYKQFDKKHKKTQSVILSKKQSIMESFEPSQQSFRGVSEQTMKSWPLRKIQQDCLFVLRKLKKHESSYPFRSPVDPQALQIPDYLDVVIQPIDLRKIEKIIKKDQYEYFSQFQRDIYKMIMNSYKYNKKPSTTYTKTLQLQEYLHSILKQFNSVRNSAKIYAEPKQTLKQQMIDEHRDLQDENAQLLRTSFKDLSTAANPFVNQDKGKQKIPNLFRQAQIAQRPRYSFKELSKAACFSQVSLKFQEHQQQQQVKQQQIEDLEPYRIAFTQPILTCLIQKDESQYINDQLKQQFQNEIQSNREINFSQGYNQSVSIRSIRHTQVQRQLSYLLKRLSEFPLAKQKKNKIVSKFKNLQQNMTQAEKKKLYDKILKLDESDIEHVILMLTKGKKQYFRSDQFQIDLDKADLKVLREIQNFITLRESNNTYGVTKHCQNRPVLDTNQHSNQIVKTKKVKKLKKKLNKRKVSRKNSNDDSFEIKPPNQKKKKSQPLHKQIQLQQPNQYREYQPMQNNQQKSQSRHHAEPIHHHPSRQSRAGCLNMTSYLSQVQILPPVQQQKTNPQVTQSILHLIPHVHQNNTQAQPAQSLSYIYDISQYLVSSSLDIYTQNHHNEESIPLSGGPIRNSSTYQLEFIQEHLFHLGRSPAQYYPDETIREYSIEDHNQDNDQDQFF